MAFVVETGSGTKLANSFATVQGMKDYYSDRGIDLTAIPLTDTQIQQALVAATDYIERRWSSRFKGQPKYDYLWSRSVLTFTDQPAADETFTIGSVVYTFKANGSEPDAENNEIEIGLSLQQTMVNTSSLVSSSTNDDVAATLIVDPDVFELTIFTARDGTATTETITNASFDGSTSSGYSGKRQPLSFPRKYLRYPDGDLVLGMPKELLFATYEYAFRASSSTLDPDPVVDDTGGRVTMKREKVDVLEEETRYSETAPISINRPYPSADRLLCDFINSSNTVIRA